MTDCYGCILNKCNWKNGLCQGTPSQNTVEFFTVNAPICGDQLGVCRTKNVPKDGCGDTCKDENQKYDKIVLSYTSEAPTKKIPKGYFCFFSIEIKEYEYTPMVYWNQSTSQLLASHSLYRPILSKWNVDKDEYLTNNDLESKADNIFKSYFTTLGLKTLEIGWINTQDTPVDKDFKIVVMKTPS